VDLYRASEAEILLRRGKADGVYGITIGDSQRDSSEISLLRKSAPGQGSQALPRSRLPRPSAKPFRGLATQSAPQSSQAEQGGAHCLLLCQRFRKRIDNDLLEHPIFHQAADEGNGADAKDEAVVARHRNFQIVA